MRPFALTVPLLLLLPAPTDASSGDRLPEYATCLENCIATRCTPSAPAAPLALRLTRWTCSDDCRYTCMHTVTDAAVAASSPIHQFHGKWPFWRLAGAQEPASVAFSLLNLAAHVAGARMLRRRIPATHPMRAYYLVWAAVSCNAWIWSAVFHTRDMALTETLDYFSAALTILYSLYYTAIRVFGLYPPGPSARPRHLLRIGGALAYLCHISYLTLLPRFDYTYNTIFNLALGFLHNLIWLLAALLGRVSGKAALFVVAVTAATALELLDFPAWRRAVDAHALWHLVTAPLTYLWYGFLAEDAVGGSTERKGKTRTWVVRAE